MSDKIRPALTARQWAHCERIAARYPGGEERAADEIGLIYGRDGVAAWALHGQPCGFTWEMVDVVRECAELVRSEGFFADDDRPRAADNVADRIAALLPPREAGP